MSANDDLELWVVAPVVCGGCNLARSAIFSNAVIKAEFLKGVSSVVDLVP